MEASFEFEDGKVFLNVRVELPNVSMPIKLDGDGPLKILLREFEAKMLPGKDL